MMLQLAMWLSLPASNETLSRALGGDFSMTDGWSGLRVDLLAWLRGGSWEPQMDNARGHT